MNFQLWHLAAIATALAIVTVTVSAENVTPSANQEVIHFHPITREQYEAILGLTDGKPVISEGRLIASGLAAITGLATGLAAGIFPTILSVFGRWNFGTHNAHKLNVTDGYPLCTITADADGERIEEDPYHDESIIADQYEGELRRYRPNYRHQGDGDHYDPEHDHHHDPDFDRYGHRKQPAVNCILVVKTNGTEVEESPRPPQRPTSRPSPGPGPAPGPGFGYPWPYPPYVPPYGPPYGPPPAPPARPPPTLSSQQFGSQNLRLEGYPQFISPYPLFVYPFYPMGIPSMHADVNSLRLTPVEAARGSKKRPTKTNHRTTSRPSHASQTSVKRTKPSKSKSKPNASAYAPHDNGYYYTPSEEGYPSMPVMQSQHHRKRKTKRDKVSMPATSSNSESYGQLEIYPKPGYQSSYYPQYDYTAQYPKVSYTQPLSYEAPVYVGETTMKPGGSDQQATPQSQKDESDSVLDSEENDDSSEYIKVRKHL